MTAGSGDGDWCYSCRHMLRQLDDGLWRHASRDDWSKNWSGVHDCGCVHEGVRCQPGEQFRGPHPGLVIQDELGVFLGRTCGHAITLAGGQSMTFGQGSMYLRLHTS